MVDIHILLLRGCEGYVLEFLPQNAFMSGMEAMELKNYSNIPCTLQRSSPFPVMF